MSDFGNVKKQLELAFAGYLKLDDNKQDAVVDMTLMLLRQMLRDKSGRKQKLTELESGKRSSAEKARAKLVRKNNAASPKAPIKPVQTTTKNELRRK